MTHEQNPKDALTKIDPPDGSAERVKAHLRRELAANKAGRRRWISTIVALVIGLTGGLVLTPVGGATVDLVRGFVSVEEPDDADQPHGPDGEPLGTIFSFADVATGTFPDGSEYRVRITRYSKDRACPELVFPDAAAGSTGATSSCTYNAIKDGVTAPVFYLPLASGNVAGFALASPEVAQASVSEGEADVIAVKGQLEMADEEPEPLPPSSVVVFWLPEGAGEARSGDSVSLTLADADGKELATEELRYVAIKLGSLPTLQACTRQERICSQAEAGELSRVDKKLGRELPRALESGLSSRGYEYTPAADADRGIPLREDGQKTTRRFYKLPIDGAVGYAYQRLGRISGNGFDDRLAFLFHYFKIKHEYRQGGGYTTADGSNVGNPFKGKARTYILDGETGKRLCTIDWDE